MAETNRLSGSIDWIDVEFVEREHTLRRPMQLGIQLHLTGLSLAEATSVLGSFGVDRCRTTVHIWVRKSDLEPTGTADPAQIALDETVINVNDQRFWLFVAVDPSTNRILHVRLSPTRTTAITGLIPDELGQKYDLAGTVFLVDGAPWLKAALHRAGPGFVKLLI